MRKHPISLIRDMTLLVSSILLTACQPVSSPLVGLIYNDTKYGYIATAASGGLKEGKACATSFFSLIATGDASLTAAKAQGDIRIITHIDHSTTNILGIYAKHCTLARGD
jgi:hypothetical protein